MFLFGCVFFSARQTLGTLERLQQSGAPVEDYDLMARACAIHLIRVCAVRSDDLHAILLEAPEEVNPTTVEIKVFPVCLCGRDPFPEADSCDRTWSRIGWKTWVT